MTVLRWKKRLQEGEGEQDRPRRGRPRKLTPALKRQVIDRAEGKRHVSNRKGMSVSRETVRRTLRQYMDLDWERTLMTDERKFF